MYFSCILAGNFGTKVHLRKRRETTERQWIDNDVVWKLENNLQQLENQSGVKNLSRMYVCVASHAFAVYCLGGYLILG